MTLGPIQFPEVLYKTFSDNKAEIGLRIPKDLCYFQGHFPDFPIVPGVVQLHWALWFAKDIFQIPQAISKGTQVKFSNLMHPLNELSLHIECIPEKTLIIYSYLNDEKKFSSGRLTYSDLPHKEENCNVL